MQVEDTDLERSTRASEDVRRRSSTLRLRSLTTTSVLYDQAMVRDLKWLGLDWDEGPDVGGPHAPYRQSERTHIYLEAAQKLVREGACYDTIEISRSRADAAAVPHCALQARRTRASAPRRSWRR